MNSNQNNQYRIFPFVILNSSRKIADPINQVDVSTKVVTPLENVSLPNNPTEVYPEAIKCPQTSKDYKPTPFDYACYISRVTKLKKYNGALYNYWDGCYHQINEDRIINIIMSYCGNELMERGSNFLVVQVAKAIEMLPEIYCETLPGYPDLIPFPNGLLSISTMQFLPPSPEIFVRYAVSVPFAGRSQDCPVFCHFLDVVTDGNSLLKQRLLEIIGYLLSAHNDAKKFFVFAGVSNSGKSVMIQLIQSLLNKECIFCADMNALGDRFTTGYMNGSHLCVFADMPGARISDQAVGIIKALTGGDTVIGERKYQAPEIIANETKLLFSTNHMIQTASVDQAVMNRCCIVPFMVGIPVEQQDPMLLQKLFAERQAIVYMSINAYREMRMRCGNMAAVFTGEEEAQRKYQQYCNSLHAIMGDCDWMYAQFVSECCILAEGVKTSTIDLYRAFCEFCQIRNYIVIPYESFSIKISECFKTLERCKIRTPDGQVNGYSGVRIKSLI